MYPKWAWVTGCLGALIARYQTLSRLPSSGHILFTVRTYVDPLAGLEQAPAAAQALAAAARRKYKGMNQYHLLTYLLTYLSVMFVNVMRVTGLETVETDVLLCMYVCMYVCM